jgi:predicted RNA methylase
LGRVETSLKERGLRGTLERALYRASLYLTPAGFEERRFDARFGVDTTGVIGRHELGLETPNAAYATEYSTTPIRSFMRIVEDLPIDHRDWVFVDIGAGKGKVMLLACLLPFKQVIGVEFAPDLARTAEENIIAYKNPRRRCSDTAVICQDATEYSFPIDKSVIFFNNPFSGPVLKRVIESIERSIRMHPRDVYIIYWNPFYADLFDQAHFLLRIKKAAQYRIYRSRPALT